MCVYFIEFNETARMLKKDIKELAEGKDLDTKTLAQLKGFAEKFLRDRHPEKKELIEQLERVKPKNFKQFLFQRCSMACTSMDVSRMHT